MGHEVVIVSCIAVSRAGILMLRYTRGNRWTLPGGKAKSCEVAEQAVCRELLEETGVTLSAAELGRLTALPTIRLRNGCRLVYFIVPLDRVPRLRLKRREHDRFVWVKHPSDIPRPVNPHIRRTVSSHLVESGPVKS